jgi:TolB protein
MVMRFTGAIRAAMEEKKQPFPSKRIRFAAAILILVALIVVGWLVTPKQTLSSGAQLPSALESVSPQSRTTNSTSSASNPEIPSSTPLRGDSVESGALIFSMLVGDYYQLFLYYPGTIPLIRISSGSWDEIHPSLSPDGTRLAFASRRSGYFDIYIWDLETGELTQLTSSPQYDGHPSWSPDSQWLVYESYEDDNLDLFIQSVIDLEQPPINLTHDPAADYAPVWSPTGRSIAFISTRSGNQEVWLANLDQVDTRFINLSQSSSSQENYPAWSVDGSHLFWSSDHAGLPQVYQWDVSLPNVPAALVGIGSQSVQIPETYTIAVIINLPGQISLSGYDIGSPLPAISQSPLGGQINGLAWLPADSQQLISNLTPNQIADIFAPLWQPLITLSPQPNSRFGVVSIEGIEAPYPFLQDNVDESFVLLQQRIGFLTGWDFLATLENAYLPLTEPPTPGNPENWLLTGRAIAVNPLPLPAGWMVIAREDYNGQTYWRIYLRAYKQDGSLGFPLRQMPWNLDTRYAGTPTSYEQGGSFSAIPPGYWIDFTSYAELFGWYRIPSMNNWRSYYQGAQYNLYALTSGLDWGAAMREIYPAEALATYTPIPTSTPTSTPTRRTTLTRTPTRTLTAQFTSTFSNFPSLTPTP